MKSYETLGEKIKSARKKRKLTQSELASTFITRTMLSKIENGVAQPSLETIKKIAHQLELPVGYFIDDTSTAVNDSNNKFIIIYEHISFLHKNYEYSKAIDYFEKIILQTDEDLDNEDYYKCLLIVTYCYLSIGNHENTSKNIETMKVYFLNNQNNYYLSKVYHLISLTAFYQNEFELSTENIKISISYFNKSYIDDRLYMIKLYYTLGYSVFELHNYLEAYNIFKEGIQYSINSSCLHRTGDMYMLLGSVSKILNKFEESIEYTLKAIKCFEVFENYQMVASCNRNLGLTYRLVEDFNRSLIYLEVALEFYEKNDDTKNISIITCDKFISLVYGGNYNESLTLSSEIEIDYLSEKDKVEFLICLSKIQTSLGNHEKSKEYLFKSEQLLSNINDFMKLKSMVYTELASLYSQEEDYKNAYLYSNKATNLSIPSNTSYTDE